MNVRSNVVTYAKAEKKTEQKQWKTSLLNTFNKWNIITIFKILISAQKACTKLNHL